jgi:hypothetical protein
MTKFTPSLAILGLALALVLPAAPAQAQASRTWVSGVGDDANPCSRTAPCKTFAGAISKTAPGGEIDALDPGGFGAVTITKAITIDGGGGQVASVLVSGTNGMIVQAGVNDVVILRNLRINGIGSGLAGIKFVSGSALQVENCDVFGFTQHAILIQPSSQPVAGARVLIKNSTAANSANGITIDGSLGAAAAVVKVTISQSWVSTNTANGITAGTTAGHSTVFAMLDRIVSSNNNGIGIQANGSVGVELGASTVTGNGTATQAINGGAVASFKNNQINENTAGDNPNLPPVPPS